MVKQDKNMKYKLKLQYDIDVPNDSKYILLYTKKNGETKFYPISEIIVQNNRYLRAEVIDKGPRTFINERIINLSPVK